MLETVKERIGRLLCFEDTWKYTLVLPLKLVEALVGVRRRTALYGELSLNLAKGVSCILRVVYKHSLR